jgi:hypothetical protein
VETEPKLDEKVNLQLMRTIYGFIQHVPNIVQFQSLRPLMAFLFQIVGQPGKFKNFNLFNFFVLLIEII